MKTDERSKAAEWGMLRLHKKAHGHHWSLAGRELELGDELVALVGRGLAELPGFFLPGVEGAMTPGLAFDLSIGWPLAPLYSTVDLTPWASLKRDTFTKVRYPRPDIAPIRALDDRNAVFKRAMGLRFPRDSANIAHEALYLDEARWMRLLVADFDRRSVEHRDVIWDSETDCDCQKVRS